MGASLPKAERSLMIISEREVRRIRDLIRKIELAERKGGKIRRNFLTNQCISIRSILNKVERRENGRLL